MLSTLASCSLALAIAACHDERTGTVAGPPLTIAPATPAPTVGKGSPPVPSFKELSLGGIDLTFAACHEVLVTLAIGRAAFAGEELAPGDVLAVRGAADSKAGSRLSGEGLALVVDAQDSACVTRTRIVRATRAAELTFGHGAMHAHLDVDDTDVAPFYLGRLSGTAGVAEHVHDQSWEVLCAVEASGTVTLGGSESRLRPRTCVSVAPGAKHSWRPDPGSNLVAIQMYSPPGPEQRFKKLAADERLNDR